MYKVVYEIGFVPHQGFWICVVVGAIGICMFRRARIPHFNLRIIRVACLLIGIVGSTVTLAQHIGDYCALSGRDAVTIEGVVSLVRPQPRGIRAPAELIRLNGQMISLEHNSMESGYHGTVAYGGILKDGVRAKILLHCDRIIRIEMYK